MMPLKITAMHDVIGKLKHGIDVEPEAVKHLVQDVLADRRNIGTWIRREKGAFQNYISIIQIYADRFGSRRVKAYRFENKNFKR